MREQMSQQSSFEDLKLERASSCDAGNDPKHVAALFGTAAGASKAATALDPRSLSSSCASKLDSCGSVLSSSCASKLDSCEPVESSPSCGDTSGDHVHAVQAVAQDSDFHCSRADLESARSCYTAATSITLPSSGADRALVPSDLMTAHPWRLAAAALMGEDVGGGGRPQVIWPFEKSPASPSASSREFNHDRCSRAWYNRIVAAQMDSDNTDDETETRTSSGSSTMSGVVSSQTPSGGALGPDHIVDRAPGEP